ncbi:anthrone oxygenase family protein [Isoptericola sp. NPDC057653]|uniref:anthrone oxygenase family protein n=1 Tax=Isoptericola sp. NPDC057653 TaxID=3346195 RepID=UPI00367FE18F
MNLWDVLLVLTTLVTGLAGGVFAAFSTFVVAGLRRVAPDDAAAAMAGINADAVRPPFMTLFGAAVVVPVVTGVIGLVGGYDGAWLVVACAVVVLVGMLGVTAAANVPLNDRLAASPDAAGWAAFDRPWSRWNHVRTVACAAACALSGAALAVA